MSTQDDAMHLVDTAHIQGPEHNLESLYEERELQNSGSVDFRVLLSRFCILFQGVISTLRILPPEKECKIGSKEPENRRTLSIAIPSFECKKKPVDLESASLIRFVPELGTGSE